MGAQSIVARHGHLSTQEGRIVDQRGIPFVLRGVSLFWSQWMPQFYNASVVQWLRDDWRCNGVRAAMAVDSDIEGYGKNPEREFAKLTTVIEGAIECGVYVVVDWHTHWRDLDGAAAFFDRLARQYGNCPNIIYETWNEPDGSYQWRNDIKGYHERLIETIRAHAPGSLIVVGTENFGQGVDIAAFDPIERDNIVYSLHFYAASHRGKLRERCRKALDMGLPLLVTEYGTCEASGSGKFDPLETAEWWRFLDAHAIGHFNWSIADKEETAAALLPGADPLGFWPETQITESGRLVRHYLRSKA